MPAGGAFAPPTTAKPDLPGVYTRYTAAQSTIVPPSPGAIVAIPLIHNWGPANSVELLNSFADWETIYGTDDSPGRRAVYDAFRGEGVEGAGGASAVYVNRMVTTSGKAGANTLKNPAAASAITIKARYPGTRGNRLKATATAIASGSQTLIILDGTAELESFSFTIAEAKVLQQLVEEINAVSPWVEATLVLEGTTGLAAGTFALTGGDDGSTLTGEDWLNGFHAFDSVDFAYAAPYDLPWALGSEAEPIRTTVAALKAWVDDQSAHGHRFTLVVGGVLDEEPSDAVARSQAMEDPAVMTVGGPGVDDDQFGPRSSAQLAPRIAGIRAQRGEGQSAHFARLAGAHVRPKASGANVSLSDIENMVAHGVVALQRDRYATAPTRIVKDVNTWAPSARSTAEKEFPRRIYGNPKFVQSMQQFANDAEAELEKDLIGKVIINKQTREVCAARVLRLANQREKIGAFQPGVKVIPLPGSDLDEFVSLEVTLAFGRALAQLFINATVS